jgi:hypothetical protein
MANLLPVRYLRLPSRNNNTVEGSASEYRASESQTFVSAYWKPYSSAPTQTVNSPVNITIVVAVGDDAPSAMKCTVLARFGDGRSWINLGQCEVSSGACTIRTTHTYGSTGTYKIEARSDRCPYNIGPTVSTNVSIFPPRPILPQPRKRPGY